MFCGVWVNISPVQLTARGQSCNLGPSTGCIQKANKDVLSLREREKNNESGRDRQTKTGRGDTSGQASLSLSWPDGLRCSVV